MRHLRSLPGRMVLSHVLIATLTSQYVGPAFQNAAMFLVLVVMLLLRPQGLLGHAFAASR